MKELKTIGLVAVAFIGVALVVGALYALHRVEDRLLANLLTVLVVAVAVAIASMGVGFGGALWRKAGNPPRPERHVIKETRIVDGRPPAPPQIIQAQPMMGPVLPDLLRAAYAAGARQGLPPGVTAEVRDPQTGDPTAAGLGDIWDGQIVEEEV